MLVVTVERYQQVKVPAGVCLGCFNDQQQFAFPFLVYCSHGETLALIRTPSRHLTMTCSMDQLPAVVQSLKDAGTPVGNIAVPHRSRR